MLREKIGYYVFMIMPFAFAWILVGQILQSGLTVDKLVKVTGIIQETKEVATRVKKRIFYTRKDLELRIYLQDTIEYFRIMEIYKYERFRGQIKPGDTAELYIRPKWLVPLGLGYRNDVFQLNVNGQTVFDISETRKNSNGIKVVSIIAIPLFIFLCYWMRQKIKKKERLQAT